MPHSEAAGGNLHSVHTVSWIPAEYQLTPCGHHCEPGAFPKGEKWEVEEPRKIEAPATPCRCESKPKSKPLLSKSGCGSIPSNPCGFPDKEKEPCDCGCSGEKPQPLAKKEPAKVPIAAPCTIRLGAVVRLVDSKDRLVEDFATFVPPPAQQPSPSPPPATVLFHAAAASAITAGPAPVAAVPAAPVPASLPAMTASILACEYVDGMEAMLGKDFVVKDMKNGCIGLPSPDGSQNGVWYFPPTALTLWEYTEDGQAPNVGKMARKFMGDPTSADLDIVPPGRYDAPWDYQIKGWSLMKPIAPHVQDHVDFERTSLRLPPWAKVRQIASVDCLDKMHHDPQYVCPPGSYTSNAARTYVHSKRINGVDPLIGKPVISPDEQTVIHSKRRPSVTGLRGADGSLTKAVISQEDSPKGKDKSRNLEVDDYFRSSDRSLSGAQGKVEREG